MTSRTFLELPAEIRNNIYRHILCFDGITPEVRSAWNSWQSDTFHAKTWTKLLGMSQDTFDDFVAERSDVRMQLDVITPVRNGIYPGVRLPVLASDILSLVYTCRQIYEEAHPIFWAENAFIFPDQDTMHAFTHRIGARSFELIRSLGIEKTVNEEWINVNGGIGLGYWFADVRIPPFLQALHLHGWETKFEEYDCKREHWVADNSDPSEVKIKKLMISCKTTYDWLTCPRASEAKSARNTSGVTEDASYRFCALSFSKLTVTDIDCIETCYGQTKEVSERSQTSLSEAMRMISTPSYSVLSETRGSSPLIAL